MELSIMGGIDKSGMKEPVEQIDISSGEVVGIVGPTGSGKTTLINDIEQLAVGDSPSRRHILLNGQAQGQWSRGDPRNKPVAQLSQNMHFLADMQVEEFLLMHAKSRGKGALLVPGVIEAANLLTGEAISKNCHLTALSGGQSRALMAADIAIISDSPIVLIDEIENAGIDRKKAVRTLVDEQKIVLMATHDPILALMGDRRLVFKNGGVRAIIETTPGERAAMAAFEEMDARLTAVRNALRNGERIDGV
jgi:ABC-type lipoprotein export system ATPase subunit